MATEHNSKLIAKLYDCTDPEKATEISDEMLEIGDSIFIYPIYSAYKRFRDNESYVTHYFVGDLTRFSTPEASEIIKEIAADAKTPDICVTYLLDYLAKIQYFEPQFIQRIYSLLTDELLTQNDQYDVGLYLQYLEQANSLTDVTLLLQSVFEDESKKGSVRSVAFRYLLKADATKFKHYFDNYSKIKDTDAEIILVKELLTWKGGIVPSFEEMILKNGSTRARELVQEKRDKLKKKEERAEVENAKAIEVKYSNADVIQEIARLRNKINTLSSTDTRFGFTFFPPSELIYDQNESAQSQPMLVGYCMSLRSFIQNFTDEIVTKEFTIEEMKSVIPDLDKPEGNINKFHVLLSKAGLSPDDGLFGLRKLNKLANALAHPDAESNTPGLLKAAGLIKFYETESWQNLHKSLLEFYRDFLKVLAERIAVKK